MVQVNYNVLNEPYLYNEEIISVLKRDIPKKWNIAIYKDFPSDNDVVRYGIYVRDVDTEERTPYQLAVQYCGSIYHTYDSFSIVYVSYQEDPYLRAVNSIIGNLVTAVKDDGKQLFDGYFERTFTHVHDYGPTQSEKHIWTFRLLRMEFNT